MKSKTGLFLAALVLVGNVFAEDKTLSFKLPTLFELKGYAGSEAVINGQMVMPFWGSEERVFFTILDGNYGFSSTSGYFADLGIGYREMLKERIYGGYLTFSGNSSPRNHQFWVLNPGFETLGEVWDFRLNGYFSFSHRSWEGGNEIVAQVPANFLGDYSDIYFTGHNEFDRLIDFNLRHYEAIHSGLGVDAEIGAKIPAFKSIKFYLGGYHFFVRDYANLTGISARITYQVNDRIKVEAIDTFDSTRKNKALLGVTFTFGGFDSSAKDRFGISSRLVDPIEHGIAARFEGTMVPVLEKDLLSSEKENKISLIHDNVWFFNPENGGVGTNQEDGTFEHPYFRLTASNFNQINPNNPWLYLSSGDYHLSSFAQNRFSLPSGWRMYGRDDNFKKPGSGENRATFYGGIDLLVGDNVLDSIRVFNNNNHNNQGVGININSAQNIYFNNIQVGTLGDFTSYQNALNITQSSNIVLDRSQIYAYHQGEDLGVFGIKINASSVTINQGNQIAAFKDDSAWDNIAFSTSYGINATGNSNLIINSQNYIGSVMMDGDLTAAYFGSSVFCYGVYLDGSTLKVGNDNEFASYISGGKYAGNFIASNPIWAYGIYSQHGEVAIGSHNSISASVVDRIATYNQDILVDFYGATGIYSEGSFSLNNNNNVTASVKSLDMGSSEAIKDIDYGESFAYGIDVSNGDVYIGNNNYIYFSNIIGARNVESRSFGVVGVEKGVADYGIRINNAAAIKIGDGNTIQGILDCKDLFVEGHSYGGSVSSVVLNAPENALIQIEDSGSAIIGNNNQMSFSATSGKLQLVNANGYTNAEVGVNIVGNGISVINSSLLTLGSNNNFSGTIQQGAITGDSEIDAIGYSIAIFTGINADSSVAMGGDNHFSESVNNGVLNVMGEENTNTTFDAEAIGVSIDGVGSNFNMLEGGNNFMLTADDQNLILGKAIGIKAQNGGTIIFDYYPRRKNNFMVGGNTGSWGIFADTLSSIEPPSFDDILNYNNFTNAGIGGFKIEREGKGLLIW
jgi:hypothetical protein